MNIQIIADATFNLYRWYRRKRELKKETEEFNRIHYSCDNPKIGIKEKMVVFMIDGKVYHGGWADRLRGILTIYYICREHGIPFRLYFKHPFDLETFFEPNHYDWVIDSSEISYNADETEAIVAFSKAFPPQDTLIMKEYMENIILKSTKKQIHVYSNIPYIFRFEYRYSQAFNELFRPTAIITDTISEYKELLKPKYISVSTRFMNLLGDFNERNSIKLEAAEQEALIASCLKRLEELHKEYPDHRIFVASDSYTFLCRADEKKYVTVSGGEPVHVDNCQKTSDIEQHKKTFIDFLLIADAERIFMLHTGKMYKGNFPYSASRLGNKPYKMIAF